MTEQAEELLRLLSLVAETNDALIGELRETRKTTLILAREMRAFTGLMARSSRATPAGAVRTLLESLAFRVK